MVKKCWIITIQTPFFVIVSQLKEPDSSFISSCTEKLAKSVLLNVAFHAERT